MIAAPAPGPAIEVVAATQPCPNYAPGTVVYLRDNGAWSGQCWECEVVSDFGEQIEVVAAADKKAYLEAKPSVVLVAGPLASKAVMTYKSMLAQHLVVQARLL